MALMLSHCSCEGYNLPMAKHEAIRTVRQEWQEFSEVVQDDINKTLEELTFEIEAANLKIAELYERDPGEAGEFATRAIDYLDSRWDYGGDHFMVTGSWYEPAVAMSHEGVLVQHQKKEAFQPSVSNGFAIMPGEKNDDTPPRIGKSFIVANFPYASAMMQGQIQLLACADLGEVSLQ